MVKLQIFFMFTPKIGEMIQFDEYLPDGLKPHLAIVPDFLALIGPNCKGGWHYMALVGYP